MFRVAALVCLLVVASPTPAPAGDDFVRGDVSANEELTILDVTLILAGIFLGLPVLCEDANDTNDTGVVNINDAIFLLGYLFSAGPPIPPPNVCDEDPTSDGLDCDEETC